jgi:hypothetical protein
MQALFWISAADWISEICVARTVDRPPNRQTLYASFATAGVGTAVIVTAAPNEGQVEVARAKWFVVHRLVTSATGTRSATCTSIPQR